MVEGYPYVQNMPHLTHYYNPQGQSYVNDGWLYSMRYYRRRTLTKESLKLHLYMMKYSYWLMVARIKRGLLGRSV